MRSVAAIPAIGLLAGSGIGLVAPAIDHHLLVLLLTGGSVVSLWATLTARGFLLAVAAVISFAAGGALLADRSWDAAWRPTLRIVFEQLASAERARAVAERTPVSEDEEASATVAGVLRSDAAPTPTGVSVSLDVESVGGLGGSNQVSRQVSGGIVVTVIGSLGPSHYDAWRAGRRVRMPVQLRRPARYLDPGVPDGERALARSGTTLVGTVKSAALVELTARAGWWAECAAAARVFARRAINRAVGPRGSRAAGIVTAIVVGDRAGMDDEVRLRLQEAGTYHVIAISGGNVAILAAALLTACRLAGWLGRPAMVATICLLLAYAGVVSGGPSVRRATLMAVVYFAGRAVDHRSLPLNTLCVAAALLVAADPLSVVDPGFALSFGATLGILLAQPGMPAARSAGSVTGVVNGRWPSVFAAIRGLWFASLAAEVLLLPVGILVFSRVTFAGLALNFLAIPLMSAAQVAGMAVVLLELVSPVLADGAGMVGYLAAEGLVWSANLVRFAPLLTWRAAPPGWAVVIIYYAAVAVGWTLWRRRATTSGSGESQIIAGARRVSVACALLAGFWMLTAPAALLAARGNARLHVMFLDVGQGDSALLRFPRGSTMLVDAGGLAGSSGFDIGDRVVAPVLRHHGIRRLDYLVLTHGDPDHIGGALSIVREFRPRQVLEGIPVPRSTSLAVLRRQAEADGAIWGHMYRGWHASIDGVGVAALHPGRPDWERQRVRNEDSIVIDVRFGDLSVLLTGDIGRDTERIVARERQPAALTILKVPHHGSRTSSGAEFLNALAPQVAVFSVGRSNRFGHPAPDVLERYRVIGATILRTDRDGAIFVDTDGHSIDVRTHVGRVLHLRQTQPRGHEDTKDRNAPRPFPSLR